jgi:hypothetical protein
MKLNVNINEEPVILLDGLTLDDLMAKYSWIFNAKTKNAILGESGNNLVWYSGEWINGEWKGGIWYSGKWYDGIWERGEWFSYGLNRISLLNGKFKIEEIANHNSIFYKGIWKSGKFHQGTFGSEDLIDENYLSTWENGTFLNGIFRNSNWKDGKFYNGSIKNSLWENGRFFNGEFEKGIWENGTWNGGDFIEGIWKNGFFTKSGENPSRFGTYKEDAEELKCIWENGIFQGAEFYSGINNKSQKISVWKNGEWRGGEWFGGQFERGIWRNGIWRNGIWGKWASDWSIPLSIEQYDSNPETGESISEEIIPFNSIDEYEFFYNFYQDNIAKGNFDFSGTTFSSENFVTDFNDNPPFYFNTNFEDFTQGETSYNLSPEFQNTEDWLTGTTTEIVSNKMSFSGETNGHLKITEQELLIPFQVDLDIIFEIDEWTGKDTNSTLYLKLHYQDGTTGDTILVDTGSVTTGEQTISIKTENSYIEKIELWANIQGANEYITLNKLQLGEGVPYFEANDVYEQTGTIYMECKTNEFEDGEFSTHELTLNIIEFDNIKNYEIRIFNNLGDNVGTIETVNDNPILQDYYRINNKGYYKILFSINDNNNPNLDNTYRIVITAVRRVFNQGYTLKSSFHLVSFIGSYLQSEEIEDDIYFGDEIRIFLTDQENAIQDDNKYRFWLTNIPEDTGDVPVRISQETIEIEGTDFEDGVYELKFNGNDFSDGYKLNIEIYRNNNFEPFDTYFNVESKRIIRNINWINLNNINEDENTYAYFRSNAKRNSINFLTISGFTFDLEGEDLELEGFKIRVYRSGFYEDLGIAWVKDNIFTLVDYEFEKNSILPKNPQGEINNASNENEFSKPVSFRKEMIEYGGYGNNLIDLYWSKETINNEFRIIYKPEINKDNKLSGPFEVEGRIYKIEARAFYHTKPLWQDGVWYNGVWIHGRFEGGTMINCNWINGDFENGIVNYKK